MEPYNYSCVFKFEERFDGNWFYRWMINHWTDSFIYSFVYLILVFGGKRYMKKRPGYELRPWLALWSSILAVFSIIGTIRTVPELIGAIYDRGLEYSACVPSFLENGVGIWACLFTMSKVYELGDTMFIVLRKQPLIFLHWYHHITVLIYCWYSYTEKTASGRWFMCMNYSVHSVMYSYYALKAMRFQVPKWINIIITLLQLSQMVIGCSLNIWTLQIKNSGRHCNQSYENIQYSLIMYFSYFCLFAHFFYNTYIYKPGSSSRVGTEKKQK